MSGDVREGTRGVSTKSTKRYARKDMKGYTIGDISQRWGSPVPPQNKIVARFPLVVP